MLDVWRSVSLSDFPQKNRAVLCLWTRLNRNHLNRIHNHNWHAPNLSSNVVGDTQVCAFLVHSNCITTGIQSQKMSHREFLKPLKHFNANCLGYWRVMKENHSENPLFQLPFYHEQGNHSHAPHLTRHPAHKTTSSMFQETKDHTDKGWQQIHIVYKYQHPNHIRWSLCLPCNCFEYSEVSRYHKLNHKIQKMFNQCLPPTLPQLLELLRHPILPVLKLLSLTFSWK